MKIKSNETYDHITCMRVQTEHYVTGGIIHVQIADVLYMYSIYMYLLCEGNKEVYFLVKYSIKTCCRT